MLVDELKKISSKYKEIILIEKGAKVEYKSTSTPQYLCSFNLDIAMRADRETKMVVNEPRCSNIYLGLCFWLSIQNILTRYYKV